MLRFMEVEKLVMGTQQMEIVGYHSGKITYYHPGSIQANTAKAAKLLFGLEILHLSCAVFEAESRRDVTTGVLQFRSKSATCADAVMNANNAVVAAQTAVYQCNLVLFTAIAQHMCEPLYQPLVRCMRHMHFTAAQNKADIRKIVRAMTTKNGEANT